MLKGLASDFTAESSWRKIWAMKEMVLMGTLSNSLQRFQRLILPDTIFILQNPMFFRSISNIHMYKFGRKQLFLYFYTRTDYYTKGLKKFKTE